MVTRRHAGSRAAVGVPDLRDVHPDRSGRLDRAPSSPTRRSRSALGIWVVLGAAELAGPWLAERRRRRHAVACAPHRRTLRTAGDHRARRGRRRHGRLAVGGGGRTRVDRRRRSCSRWPGPGLTFGMWWMYFMVPSADVLHAHRERSFGSATCTSRCTPRSSPPGRGCTPPPTTSSITRSSARSARWCRW